MASEYKTCPKCERTLLRADWFYHRKNGARGMRWESYCKSCCSQQNGPASPHYEKAKERHRHWYARNRDNERTKTLQRYPDLYARRKAGGYYLQLGQSQRERLTDNYVKNLLTYPGSGLTRDQVTPALVDLKREQVDAKRAKRLILNALKALNETLPDAD